MRYSVGEVARLLNMTPSALRFYETEQIIHTQKSHSGRRYYGLEDLVRLISSRKYSSMEIPIKTIAGQFKAGGDSRQVIAGRLQQKAAEAMTKSRYYQHLSEIIAEQADVLGGIDQCLNRFSVRIREGYYVLTDEKHQLMSYEKSHQELIQQWIKATPATKIAVISECRRDTGTSAALCYAISEKHADWLNIPREGRCIRYLPPGTCLHTAVCLKNAFAQPEQIFESADHYFRSKFINPIGTSLAVLSVVESITDTHYQTYLEVTVPIEI